MSAPYMQLYVADYLGDTRHLTTEQHGAYLLLLMTMWRSDGVLSDDPAKLARIAGLSLARWKKISDDVLQFFTPCEGGLTQARLAAELSIAEEKTEKRSQSGRAGGRAKALKDKKASVANAMPLPCHSPEPEPEGYIKERGREMFDEAWEAFPESGRQITDEPLARAAWDDAAADVAEDELLEAVRRFSVAPQPRKRDLVPSMQRWLTGRRYRAFLAQPEAGKPPAKAWDGPAELRAAVAAEAGEGAAANYIDPAGWDGKAIIARTAYGADRLRALRALSGVTIRVAEKEAA